MQRAKWIFSKLGIWLGAIALIAGLLLNQGFYPHNIATETINLKRDRVRLLVGRLYIPDQTKTPYPTIILWHGVSSSKEMMEPLAVELARQGIAAIAFDAGGFGESYARPFSSEENLKDAGVVFDYVKQHPERFDRLHLGMGGHSMGAATAIAFGSETASSDQIRVTIALGMSAEISRKSPANLLMEIGLYEELHSPAAMRETLLQGTGEATQEFQLKGDFQDGSARKLVISSTSNHLIEPFDTALIQEAVVWAMRAFGLPERSVRLTMPFVMWGWFLIFIGSVLSIGYGLRELNFLKTKLRSVSLGMVAIAAIFLCLGMTGAIPSRMATSLVFLVAAVLPISTYAINQPKKLTSFLQLCGLYVGAILIAYAIVSLVMRWQEFLTHPAYLLGLPQFLAQLPVAMIYSRVQELNAAIFPVYSNGLVPSWQLSLLFLPELIYPSVILSVGTRAAAWLVRWLRQPLKLAKADRPSKKSLQLLGGLSLVLAIVLIQQARMGTVSMEYAIIAISLLARMVLFPALLLVLMVRSPQFQALERRCLSNL
jgi:pimeloyl-ACP methyl ester carboxylesterase